MIRKGRLVSTFLELVRLDSPSRSENAVAQHVISRLEQLGAEVFVDRAAGSVNGNSGNVIARLPGSAERAPILMLNAHLDTVAPGEGVRPIREGSIIRSGGDTILGADDKAGVAIILELLAALREQSRAFGDLDIVFTVCEEIGLHGSKNLDYALIRANHGYVLDSGGKGVLHTEAPSSDILIFEIHGIEAHAGVEPEKGINAIQIAAEAIAQMKLGRIDYQTTANIGVIEGGKATNIVPDFVRVKGEARSHDECKLAGQTQHMQACMTRAMDGRQIQVDGQIRRARIKASIDRSYWAMKLSEEDYVVKLALRAARALRQPLELKASGGGSDANVFNKHGIQTAILCNGSHAVHTLNEYLSIPDMFSSAKLALQAVLMNAASG